MEMRNVKPEEIKVRATVNKGGVSLLLWKVPRANLDILDECVGITNRSVTYSDNGKRCSLSVRIDGEWITNDGYCYEESPDNAPNDALNHAGHAWGIGTELFTAPEMFIFKSKLKNHSVDEASDTATCYDTFKVKNISYEGKRITSVTIAVCEYGKEYRNITFTADAKKSTASESAPVQTPQNDTATEKAPVAQKSSDTRTETSQPTVAFSDSEVILLGNCKGKTYGEVKGTAVFASFLEWAKKANRSYTDPQVANQLQRFKNLALAG